MPDSPTPNPFASFAARLRNDWRGYLARPEQLAPPGDWSTWVFCGGRGAGKTRSGAEWIQERVESGIARRIHLVAPTAADCRDVIMQGPAGIESISAPHMRPEYQSSLRKVTWPNGAVALLFSSDEPDRLRGPQCDTLWIDELCAMRSPQEVLDMGMLGLRLSRDPKCLITTTPRPIKPFKALLARDGTDVIVTRCSTLANSENLPKLFLDQILGRFEGTRLGRQEINAELLDDVPGALWQMARIDELRVRSAPDLTRIVVAIDPAVTSGEDSDETGIVVAGIASDGHGYILDDLSGKYQPVEWARRAIAAYHEYKADRVIGETNNGGDMIEATLRSVDPNVSYRSVHASRGKAIRAEPISALYEKGAVHHVGDFAKLEDQLCAFTQDAPRSAGSPDRADALVWALSELMGGENSFQGWKDYFLMCHRRDVARDSAEKVISPASLPVHEKTAAWNPDGGDLMKVYLDAAAQFETQGGLAVLTGDVCHACGRPIDPRAERILADYSFHPQCFRNGVAA